jgi:ferredoxin
MDRLSVEKAALLYLSPHGATRKAIQTVAEGIKSAGLHCDFFDASRYIKKGNDSELYVQLSYYKMLVIGTPVYFNHLPDIFRELLEKIPSLAQEQTAAFIAVYGGISSGMVLHELAAIFGKKKYRLLGGMKVAAENCLMFQSADPINSGRPGKEDVPALQSFGKSLVERLTSRDRKGFTPNDFMDKSLAMRINDSLSGVTINRKLVQPPISWDKGRCSRCGDCVEVCPTANIFITDDLGFRERCINCYACVRICPEKSLTAPLIEGEDVLRKLQQKLAKYEKGDTAQVV